jgi:hypothetical protein
LKTGGEVIDFEHTIFWIAGLVMLGLVILALIHHFGGDARTARRRARSHGPVVSRKRGPSIRLAVKSKRRRDRRTAK